MNCNDISRFLDEREAGELTSAELGELKAHVSSCEDCAGQWLASERIADFRSSVPALPAPLAERVRQLRDQGDVQPGPSRTRRPVIIGSLLLLGAAATTLAAFSWQDTRTANQ